MTQKQEKFFQHHFIPEIVNGIAIDNPDTGKCHQVFTAYYDKALHSERLDCAVTAADFMRDIAVPPKEFFQTAKNSYADRTLRRKLVGQYIHYYNGLVFGQECFAGFSENIYKPAIVCSYLYNDNKITHRSMTYGVARVKDQLDYNVVNNIMDKGKIDLETKAWFNVMTHQSIPGTRPVRQKHTVQSAAEKMSVLIQQTARDESVHHGIETIFQVEGKHLTSAFKRKKKNNFVGLSQLQDQNINTQHWQMHVTNTNTDVAVLNSGLLYYFLSTGHNLLTPDIVGAMATAYQTGFNTGKTSSIYKAGGSKAPAAS